MKTYYIYYPRNFANEYTIFSVDEKDLEAFTEWQDKVTNDPNRDIQRISYKDAQKKATPTQFDDGITDFGAWYRGR